MNYLKFDMQYWYTPILEATQLPLDKSSKQWTSDQYQGSDNCGGLDLKVDVH